MSAKIKTGDQVVVIAGRDKGRTGKVLSVSPKSGRALVEGVNLIKRHQKQSATQEGGIISKPAMIAISNVMVADPEDNKPTRVQFKFDDQGNKIRVAKRSGKVINA